MLNEAKLIVSAISDKLKDNAQVIEYCKTMKTNICNENQKNLIVSLNIGGKEYSIMKNILLSIEGTLFYCYFVKEQYETVVFFDRDGEYFNDIIDYYNYRCLPLITFSNERLKRLQSDAIYYEIHPLANYIHYFLTPIQIESIMSISTIYDGENNINASLTSTESRMGVISIKFEYYITFKLNITCEFDSISIKGYSGVIRNGWDSNNGNFSLVYTSLDNYTWLNVGQLPSDIRTIKTIQLFKSKGRYIKFSHYQYLGIGYLKINKC